VRASVPALVRLPLKAEAASPVAQYLLAMRGEQDSRTDGVDLVVALAFTLALQIEIWAPELLAADTDLTQRPGLSALSLLISLPLVVRRTAPWPAGLVSLAAAAALGRFETPPEGLANLAVMLVVVYSLGCYAARPRRYLGLLPVLLCAATLGENAADKSFIAIVLGAAWLAGALVGRRSDDVRHSEREKLDAAEAGAEAERHRIASELHDVVAHRVSMIVVQSQAADALLDSDPPAARRAVRAVEDAARQALSELRQVVGVLKEASDADPQAVDLTRLGTVVANARSAGVQASLRVDGAVRPVAPVVALAVFRIVQESLTNAARHAAGSAVDVTLTYALGSIELAVQDHGPRVTSVTTGHGLSGMAERIAFVGGRFSAAPGPAGGFLVRASIPTAVAVP
jgi:signal transduction histidine kinase